MLFNHEQRDFISVFQFHMARRGVVILMFSGTLLKTELVGIRKKINILQIFKLIVSVNL